MISEILSLAEVAGRLHVTDPWLREYVRRKKIRVLRAGPIILFDDVAFADLEAAMRPRYGSSGERDTEHSPQVTSRPLAEEETLAKILSAVSQGAPARGTRLFAEAAASYLKAPRARKAISDALNAS
jgi:hypothetical protein